MQWYRYFFSTIILTSACTIAALAATAQQPPTIKDDEFEPQITIIGNELGRTESQEQIGSTSYKNIRSAFFLRSWMNKKTAQVTHQLYVTAFYRDKHWRFWGAASDDTSASLSVVKIASEASNCSDRGCFYQETFGVELTDEFLRIRRDNGFRLKLRAKSGAEDIVTVSATQIVSQLRAVDEHAISLER